MKRACPLIVVLMSFLFTAATAAAADLKSLVEAERAFSRLSAEKGIRTAFLANLAPDAVVFRPTPVPGRDAYQKLAAEVPARLTWRPTFADISRAGDLGYTTGPYELRPNGEGTGAPSYGHFVSVWRVQPDGSWKVVIDVGNSHPRPAVEAPDLKFDEVWLPPPTASNPEEFRTALLKVDVALGLAATQATGRYVLSPMFADDVRVYRPNHEPLIGRAAAEKSFADMPDKWTWVPKDGAVAASADLGYTYGSLKAGSAEYVYFRIWKGSGREWRLVLDLLSPVPAKPGTGAGLL